MKLTLSSTNKYYHHNKREIISYEDPVCGRGHGGVGEKWIRQEIKYSQSVCKWQNEHMFTCGFFLSNED